MAMPLIHQRADPKWSAYRSVTLFSVVVVFTFTSTVSVILRFLAKRVSKTRLAVEDFTVLVAQFLLYGMATCVLLGGYTYFSLASRACLGVPSLLTAKDVFLGSAGQHADRIPPHHITQFLKILVALQVFYGTTLGLIKTSICLFYIRIFFTRPFRIAAWTVVGFVVSWGLMVFLTAFLLCTPLAFNWDQSIQGHCANQTTAFIVVGVLDLIIDCAVVVLPIPMIYRLQTNNANKIALFGVFGLGVTTMIISILRIKALVAVSFTDITYTAAYPALWSFLEPAIAITVACGPIFWPLLKKYAGIKQSQTPSKGDGSSKNTFQRLNEQSHRSMNVADHISNIKTTVTARNTNSACYSDDQKLLNENPRKATITADGSMMMEPMNGRIVVKKEWETSMEAT